MRPSKWAKKCAKHAYTPTVFSWRPQQVTRALPCMCYIISPGSQPVDLNWHPPPAHPPPPARPPTRRPNDRPQARTRARRRRRPRPAKKHPPVPPPGRLAGRSASTTTEPVRRHKPSNSNKPSQDTVQRLWQNAKRTNIRFQPSKLPINRSQGLGNVCLFMSLTENVEINHPSLRLPTRPRVTSAHPCVGACHMRPGRWATK